MTDPKDTIKPPIGGPTDSPGLTSQTGPTGPTSTTDPDPVVANEKSRAASLRLASLAQDTASAQPLSDLTAIKSKVSALLPDDFQDREGTVGGVTASVYASLRMYGADPSQMDLLVRRSVFHQILNRLVQDEGFVSHLSDASRERLMLDYSERLRSIALQKMSYVLGGFVHGLSDEEVKGFFEKPTRLARAINQVSGYTGMAEVPSDEVLDHPEGKPASIEQLQRSLAETMQAHPEDYWEYECFRNAVAFLVQHVDPKDYSNVNVLFFTPRGMRTAEEVERGKKVLHPGSNLVATDSWKVHVVLEVAGRIYDFDDKERPGESIAQYAYRMFGDQEVDVIRSDVVSFLKETRKKINPRDVVFGMEAPREKLEDYAARTAADHGDHEGYQNLRRREDVYNERPMALEWEIKGERVVINYERNVGWTYAGGLTSLCEVIGRVKWEIGKRGDAVREIELNITIPEGPSRLDEQIFAAWSTDKFANHLASQNFSGRLFVNLRIGNNPTFSFDQFISMRENEIRAMLAGSGTARRDDGRTERPEATTSAAPATPAAPPPAAGESDGEGDDQSSSVDFTDLYNAIWTLGANQGNGARRALLSDEQMRAFSDAVDEETVGALLAAPEVRAALLTSLDHPDVKKNLGDDACAACRKVLEQGAEVTWEGTVATVRRGDLERGRGGAGGSYDPVETAWNQRLDEAKIREATAERYALGADRIVANQGFIEEERLDEIFEVKTGHMEASLPGTNFPLVHFIQENILPANEGREFKVLEIGAGVSPRPKGLDRQRSEENYFSYSPFHWALMGPNVYVDARDISRRVVDAINKKPPEMVIPSFFLESAEIPEWEKVVEELKKLGSFERFQIPQGREFWHGFVSDGIARRVTAQQMDAVTESYGDKEYDLVSAIDLQDYFYSKDGDRLLVDVNLIKMLKRVRLGGHIVVSALRADQGKPPLTNEEFAAFGFENAHPSGKLSISVFKDEESVYVFKRTQPSEVLNRLAERIEAVQAKARSLAPPAAPTGPAARVVDAMNAIRQAQQVQRADVHELIAGAWKQHLDTNKSNILRAAELVKKEGKGHPDSAKRPTVIVLGAGECFDIPLRELAQQFHVVLVDGNLEAITKARSALPDQFQKYVELRRQELTGGLRSGVMSEGERIVETSRTVDEAIERLTQFFETIEVPEVDLSQGEPVDFVVSSMLLNQLGATPSNQVIDVLLKKFGDAAIRGAAQLAPAVKKFKGRTSQANTKAIQNLVDSGAVAYVANDMVHLMKGKLRVEQANDPEGRSVLDLATYFSGADGVSIHSRSDWQWTYRPGMTDADVQAVVLVSKDQAGQREITQDFNQLFTAIARVPEAGQQLTEYSQEIATAFSRPDGIPTLLSDATFREKLLTILDLPEIQTALGADKCDAFRVAIHGQMVSELDNDTRESVRGQGSQSQALTPGSGVGTTARQGGRVGEWESGRGRETAAAVDFTELYNAIWMIEANRDKDARRALLSDEQMSAFSDAIDDDGDEGQDNVLSLLLGSDEKLRAGLLKSLDHPDVKKNLGDDACTACRKVLENVGANGIRPDDEVAQVTWEGNVARVRGVGANGVRPDGRGAVAAPDSGTVSGRGDPAPTGDLRPSVKGGKYDPERIKDRTVSELQQRLRRQLDTGSIVKVASERVGKSRDDLLFGTRYAERHLKAYGGDTDFARGTMGYTFFARRHAEFEYLRTTIIPKLEEGQDEIVIGDFGPGFEKRPITIDGTSRNYFTFEPYLLAALSKKVRVIPYDIAPETIEAMQDYDGNIHLTEMWRYLELDRETSGLVDHLKQQYGDNWEEKARRHGEFFERFVSEHGGKIRYRKWVPSNQLPVPMAIVQFPEDAFEGVEVPQGTVDITVDPLDARPMDIAYFHLHGYLDWGSGNNLLSLATLIRIVDRLKPGGYLVTESPSYKFDGVTPPHIPNPALMRALGLIPVIDMSRKEHGGTLAMIFQKEGNSNEFVGTMAKQIEAALETARSKPRETGDEPARGRAGRGGRERSRGGRDAAAATRIVEFERQYLAQRDSAEVVIDDSALAIPSYQLISTLYRNPPTKPMTIRGKSGAVRVSMEMQGDDLVVTVHIRIKEETAEAVALKIDSEPGREAWSAQDSSGHLTLIQCLIKPESVGGGGGMRFVGLRGTGSHRVDLGDERIWLKGEQIIGGSRFWDYDLDIMTKGPFGVGQFRGILSARNVGVITATPKSKDVQVFLIPLLPGELKIRVDLNNPHSFVAERDYGGVRERIEGVSFVQIHEPKEGRREIVFKVENGGEVRRVVSSTGAGKSRHSGPEVKNPVAPSGSFASLRMTDGVVQDDRQVAVGEPVGMQAIAAGEDGSDLEKVQRDLAEAMLAHPEVYWEGNCIGNIGRFLTDHVSPEHYGQVNVLFLVHQNTKTLAQWRHNPVTIVPSADVQALSDKWAHHVVLEIGGRIYDFDYSGKPGEAASVYFNEMFPRQSIDLVSVKADEFLKQFERNREAVVKEFVFGEGVRRYKDVDYSTKVAREHGIPEEYADLDTRKEVYDRVPLSIQPPKPSVSDGRLDITYERKLGGRFNPKSFASQIWRYAFTDEEQTADEINVTVKLPADCKVNPQEDLKGVAKALSAVGFRGGLRLEFRIGRRSPVVVQQKVEPPPLRVRGGSRPARRSSSGGGSYDPALADRKIVTELDDTQMQGSFRKDQADGNLKILESVDDITRVKTDAQKWTLSELPDGTAVAVISLGDNKIGHKEMVPHKEGKIICAGTILKDADGRIIFNGKSGDYLSVGRFVRRKKSAPYSTASYSGLYVAKPILEKLLGLEIFYDKKWELEPTELDLQTSGEFEALRPDELDIPDSDKFLPVDQERLLRQGVAVEEVFRKQSEAIARVQGRRSLVTGHWSLGERSKGQRVKGSLGQVFAKLFLAGRSDLRDALREAELTAEQKRKLITAGKNGIGLVATAERILLELKESSSLPRRSSKGAEAGHLGRTVEAAKGARLPVGK